MHTIKTARRSIIFVVPLEIELAIGVGPETGAWRIAPEIVRIAFHGTVYPAYRSGTTSIICGKLPCRVLLIDWPFVKTVSKNTCLDP